MRVFKVTPVGVWFLMVWAVLLLLQGCASTYHVTDAEGRRTEVTCAHSFWNLNEYTCDVKRPGEVRS